MGLMGPSRGQTLSEWVKEINTPDPFGGMPASPLQMEMPTTQILENFLKNGDFESWSGGTSVSPDGWTLTGTGAITSRNVTNVQRGLASIDFANGASNAADLGQSITISSTQNTQLRGRTFTFSCWIRLANAGRVFLRLDDGVGTTDSPFIAESDSRFRQYSVTRQISSTATKIEASIEITSGPVITIQIDAAILSEGRGTPAFSPHPADLLLIPRTASATNRVTTTSTTLVGMSLSIPNVIVNGKQSVVVSLVVSHDNSGAGNRNIFAIDRDGTKVPSDTNFFQDTLAQSDTGDHTKAQVFFMTWIDRKPASGNYTYQALFRVSAGTGAVELRALTIQIIPDE